MTDRALGRVRIVVLGDFPANSVPKPFPLDPAPDSPQKFLRSRAKLLHRMDSLGMEAQLHVRAYPVKIPEGKLMQHLRQML